MCIFSTVNSQFDSGKVINTCGKKLTNEPPNSSEDCKPGADYFQCCYVYLPKHNNGQKFCSYLSGTINDQIKESFIEILEESEVNTKDYEIICNNSKLLRSTIVFLLTIGIIIF